jgi:hypothetical protein
MTGPKTTPVAATTLAINADHGEAERLRRSRQQVREGAVHWGVKDETEIAEDALTNQRVSEQELAAAARVSTMTDEEPNATSVPSAAHVAEVRYKVQADDMASFRELEIVLSGATTVVVYASSDRRLFFATGPLPPEVRHEITERGGRIVPDRQYQPDAFSGPTLFDDDDVVARWHIRPID